MTNVSGATRALIFAILLLSGCASTRNTALVSVAGFNGAVPPDRLVIMVVDATAHSANGNERSSDAMQRGRIAALLQEQLVQKFGGGRGTVMSASAAAAGPAYSGRTLLLRCRLAKVSDGNQALRLIVGFGAGRATLQLTTDLLELRGKSAVELATFNTRSTTGAMPGPGLGLASGAASGQLLGLAGGSAGLLLGMRETLNREIDQSSTKIASNLKNYFQDQGWVAFNAPVRSALGSNAVPPPPVHS
ncbi:MAG: DUF4410 domain-containing protein [Janthinobacterium lividum]